MMFLDERGLFVLQHPENYVTAWILFALFLSYAIIACS